MPTINIAAVLAATVLAFLAGFAWNSLFAGTITDARMAAGTVHNTPGFAIAVPVELLRLLVTVFVLAIMLAWTGTSGLAGALGLALVIWVGFQAALLSGAIIWEGMPMHIYAVHAGDALIKLLLIAAVLAVWK